MTALPRNVSLAPRPFSLSFAIRASAPSPPPPLPVKQVFIALDGQNFGDTGLDPGVDYQVVGCPPGMFASAVDQYCQPW